MSHLPTKAWVSCLLYQKRGLYSHHVLSVNVYLFSKRPKCDARRLDRVRMAIPQMSNKGLARRILAPIGHAIDLVRLAHMTLLSLLLPFFPRRL